MSANASVFVQSKVKCRRCGKNYKTFGQMYYLALDKILPLKNLCGKCRGELKKTVKDFCNYA